MENNLKHTIQTKDKDGNRVTIDIRLSDDHKNGHQDFAITGTIWEKGKPKEDKWIIGGGCIHDTILECRPDLKIFVDLHLSDYTGVPMYAIENGRYHMREGFNSVKPDNPEFPAKFCEYYRVTPEQFKVLQGAASTVQYAIALQNLGILDHWKAQADEAIKRLEEMTGETFLIDSEKTQLNWPTPEQLKEEEERQKSGYYTPKAREERKAQAIQDELERMREAADKKIKEIETEFYLMSQVFLYGGKAARENCIFYNHTQKLTFNWGSHRERVSPETIQKVMDQITLPEGVEIVVK